MEQKGNPEIVWRTTRAFLIAFVTWVGLLTLVSFTGATQQYGHTVYVTLIFAAFLSVYYDKKASHTWNTIEFKTELIDMGRDEEGGF